MPKNVDKMSLNYSPNFNEKKRASYKVKYIIFHYTGMKSEIAALRRLTNVKSKVSSVSYTHLTLPTKRIV